MGLDVGVDPAGVGFELEADGGVELGDGAVSHPAQVQPAVVFVDLHRSRAQDFRELAAHRSAQGLHLPEALLGVDVALGEEQVFQAGGGEVGDGALIAQDAHRPLEAGYVHLAVIGGQGVVGSPEEPARRQQQGQYGQEEKCEEKFATARHHLPGTERGPS